MTKTRERVVLPPANVSRELADAEFAKYAKADAKQQKIKAEMDLKMAKIREANANELASLDEEKDAALVIVQAFAMQNREELFSKKKSMEMANGTIGFRTATPALKPLKGFTWASIAKLVKVSLPSYIRTIEEVDKQSLLADREVEEVATKLKQVGVQVVQDEAFFIEPKKEEA